MTSESPTERVESLPAPPERFETAHKGSFGKVLIVAGSRGMSGAATLAGMGALRGGAGLVTVAVPGSIQSTVAKFEPSYLTIGLPEDAAGRIQSEALHELDHVMPQQSVVAVGPGWGRSEDLNQLAEWFFSTVTKPVIFDADALNALSENLIRLPEPPRVDDRPVERILTPHPGEFARLLGIDISKVQSNREELAIEFAAKYGIVLVLKGHRTIVTDGRRIALNNTGNSGMATAGMGDVLTGLIAALIAQKMPAFEASHLAVHLHGLAGDIAAEELSKQALIASDLMEFVPEAWLEIDS